VRTADNYTPAAFWDRQDTYIETAVEKVDLRNLFAPVCADYYVPIINVVGWSDLHTRVGILMRFYRHWQAGRRLVLLWCGDHDPGGLVISNSIRSNLHDMAGAVARELGVSKDEIEMMVAEIIIDRFGLNAYFIDQLGLTWIDNLETSSGQNLADMRHRDHYKPYVQDYIGRFGVRKCEAKALVVQPVQGRLLCRDAILRYLPLREPRRYRLSLRQPRAELRLAIRQRFNLDE
jgi:hypothetical protein